MNSVLLRPFKVVVTSVQVIKHKTIKVTIVSNGRSCLNVVPDDDDDGGRGEKRKNARKGGAEGRKDRVKRREQESERMGVSIPCLMHGDHPWWAIR